MSVLLISSSDLRQIETIIQEARASPVRWADMKPFAIAGPKPRLSLEEREPGMQFVRPKSHHIILGGYRAAFSFEEQPSGMVRHLSVSTREPGDVPSEIVVAAIAAAFGAEQWPPKHCRVWLEEFERGHEAVNVAWLDIAETVQ